MVSDTRKEKLFFDIIKSQNITYQRKGASLMNISISQNFKNVLKNKIKILISPILYKSIDFIIDNLFEINNPDKYFYFMNTIQSSVKELIKNIVITAFEEVDNNFKNSNNRTSRYIINIVCSRKSNFTNNSNNSSRNIRFINNISRGSII